MDSPPNTILPESFQTEEPEEYGNDEESLIRRPVILRKPPWAHSRDRTLTRRTMTSPDYNFAGEGEYRQRSLSTPTYPFRSFSVLSESTPSISSGGSPHGRISHESMIPNRSMTLLGNGINFLPVTPAHIMKKKYRRDFYMYVSLNAYVVGS